MIKFTADKDGRLLIGLGLSAGNVERLKRGMPIHIFSEEIGLPLKAEIMIMYGETEQAMADELTAIGALGPQTEIVKERPNQ